MTTMSETTIDQRPAPPVPPHVDLTDFPFFPLDAVRLRDSDLSVKASGEEFKAAVLLWCASWHQVPAASLPNDDALLAKFAGYGRTETEAWKAIRMEALRGFKECADGRLYHALMAEKANEAWTGKLRLRHKRECERIKKAAQRAQVQPIYPTFDEWCAHVDATGEDKWEPKKGTSLGVSQGTTKGSPENVSSDVPDDVPLVSASDRGQGTGTGDRGKGTEEKHQSSLRSDSSSAAPTTSAGGGQQDQQNQKSEAAAGRLRQHTLNAITAFNEILGRPNGLLTKVSTTVGLDTHVTEIRRCLKTASEINREVHGDPAVTIEFWREYFGICKDDPFKSGEQGGGKGHENWKPSFEYLTRKRVMLEVFEREVSEAETE